MMTTAAEAARPPRPDDDPDVRREQAACRDAGEQLAAAEATWAALRADLRSSDPLRILDARVREDQARLAVQRAQLVVDRAAERVRLAREAAQKPLDRWHVARCKALAPKLIAEVERLRGGVYREMWTLVAEAINDGSGSAVHKQALLLNGAFDLDRASDSTPTEAAVAQLRRWLSD
jgi:hypothetical protein